MRNHFDRLLEELNHELIEMGALCEELILITGEALVGQSGDVLKRTAPFAESIDQKERSIEAMCLKLLLQQQPVAKDLREISSALKMITDLKRIGDHAQDIAEIISYLEGRTSPVSGLIHSMARASKKMVTDSIDTFVKGDLLLAEKVIAADDVVDSYFSKVNRALIELITENPQDGEYALDLLMIAKYYERIGDHAVNVANWVVFSVTGVHGEGSI